MNLTINLATRAIITTLALGLLTTVTQTLAQDAVSELPPHVIGIEPFPGEEVAVDQPVIVTFDQAMDKASVETSWHIDPALPGTFTWIDDRTVSFLPEGNWQRATRYIVTLDTAARATNGLTLEDAYTFAVQTIGRLEVAAVIPADGAEGVAADATITVSFNRPVVPLLSTAELDRLPHPLAFDPPIEGTGEWINTSIYMFTPAKPLAGGTTYTASIPAGLTDVLGATLDETFRWEFQTLPPEILNVSPRQGQQDIVLDTPVVVQFSQPMDHPSTEEAFLLMFGGERVKGAFNWSDDSRTLTFVPDDLLRIQSTYLLSVAPTARNASGEATLEAGISYSFSTIPYPGILHTNPANNERDVYPGNGVTITFKSPMDTETFAGKAEIVAPEGVEWEPIVQSNDQLYMQFATQPDTTYTIRFKRGAKDIYGNAIDTDYIFTFTTGPIESWAFLPASDRFMLTNAYRSDTRLALSVQGKPTMTFTLYQIKNSLVGRVMRSYPDDLNKVLQESPIVRHWTETLDASPALYGTDDVFLASEQGGQLSSGVYYLHARRPGDNYPQTLALGVVTANLTVKRSPDELLIWVTDIESGVPLADIPVSLYAAQGTVFASERTGSDGIVRFTIDRSAATDKFVYAIAQDDRTFGVWMSWGTSAPPRTAGYLYTDRPIYRPGETVYFRGAVRDREDMTYRVPNIDRVDVTIDVNWGDQTLFEGTLPLSEYGTFDGKIDLPEDVQLGQANINVRWRGGYGTSVSFTIAEFRVPEYKVAVTPDYDTIIQGDPLKAIIAASYYFGGPVSNADMRWTAYGEPASFNYTGPGRYTFADETQDYFGYIDLKQADAQTNANGQVIVDLDATQAPSRRPMQITLEGEVWDESGQYISGRASVLAHPAEVYVGLRTDRYFGREGSPMTLDLIAVTPQSEPLPDHKIELRVVEVRWERIPVEGEFGRYTWERKEIDVETGEVITGADGTARYTFTPPRAGIYRVQALTRDDRERLNSSTLRFWVTGSTPVWWGRPRDTIDLVADQDSYQPGDTAEILVPTPFTGTSYALVAVERAGIQRYDVIRIDGSTLVYQLPITEEHVPTIYVSVALMKGTDEENLNPSYRTGAIALTVEPVNRRLHVTITPSATRAQPGETVSLDVKTVDARGEPVSAEVGVTVTDLAILSLAPPNSPTLEEAFYGHQSNYVQTDVALQALLDIMTDEMIQKKAERELLMAPMAAMPTDGAMAEEALPETGGGNSLDQVTIRQDFQQTPLWAPRVTTGVDGQASVSVTLPDNLTTWHVDARGLTADTRVGDSALDIISTLPLLTRPVAPRFFVVGDRVVLASVINNNTDETQNVQATLQASGVAFESDETQTVVIEAGARARVEWTVVVQDVPYVDLTFFAVGADGYQDASKPTLATGPDGTIPVYRYTAPDTVGTGGMLRTDGTRTEAISLPPNLDTDQGELTLHLDPSLAVTTVDALGYLKNYPHQCIEQTVSRFLPNVMTYRALKDLGLDDPKLEANLKQVLDEALAKLTNAQNPDGGWGWFTGMESNPYITAYAVLGLVEAQQAGFVVDQTMIERALNFVRADLVRPTIDTPVWQLNRQAFYLYVFARAGYASPEMLNSLLDYRLKLDYGAAAFLLMAYHATSPSDPAVAQLVSDLQTAAILSATGAHWEERAIDWWNWSSDTRSTAIILAALTRVQPEHDLLPNVVRWLMIARQGDHWRTTQETAWAVMALTDWMVASGELRGNYDYQVLLNGGELAEKTVTPETIREGNVLRVQIKDLLADEINRLTITRSAGEGALYYTAHLQTRLWASEAKPISRGMTVTREFYLADALDEPVTSAQAGDVITVRVTLTLPQDVYYFVLEDPIPAGTEPVDTSLLTTSQSGQAPQIRPDHDPRWYWGWWLFDRTEMRDEQVNLYADFLPRGTYVYTYQVRATIPGEYQTMPSHAYAFYFPEVFGRGAGTLFTITPQE